MLKLFALVLFLSVATGEFSSVVDNHVLADKEYLMKQKAILQLVFHVQHPLIHPTLKEIAENFKMVENKRMYDSEEVVTKFWKMWESQMFLKRGDEFTAMKWEHYNQAEALMDVLFNAKDWDTFYKTAVWARQNMNERLFLFSLNIVMGMRNDTKHLTLPAMYEMVPQMFIRTEVMQKAFDTRMKLAEKASKDVILIPSNFSEWFHTTMDPEMRMMYWTEDVSLNAWNWEFKTKMQMLAKWLENHKDLSTMKFVSWKWMLNRYNLERISNNLYETKKFDWEDEMVGFAPHLKMKNGKEMSMRPPHMLPKSTKNVDITMLKYTESHLKEMQDKMTTKELREYFMNLFSVIGLISDPMELWNVSPGAIMFYETQLRDPMYYSLLMRFWDVIMPKMPAYKKDDLILSGVVIENLETDKLITFFENFDVELNSAFDVNSFEEEKKISVVARSTRLNHKSFNYRINVASSVDDMKVKIRVFLAPKLDVHGIEMTLKEKMPFIVEIDEFQWVLKSGKNKIERNSQDSVWFTNDKDSYKNLYKKVEDALQGKTEYYYKKNSVPKLPHHLLLPKGKKTGMPYTMIVTISKWNQMGREETLTFPFDRTIENDLEFNVPNIFEKEVIIYHKKTDESVEAI